MLPLPPLFDDDALLDLVGRVEAFEVVHLDVEEVGVLSQIVHLVLQLGQVLFVLVVLPVLLSLGLQVLLQILIERDDCGSGLIVELYPQLIVHLVFSQLVYLPIPAPIVVAQDQQKVVHVLGYG
ncbi:MAG: hypothetical protein ACMG6E_08750 [Candidatus Roizmanbacteria bacterium]